MTLPPEKVGYKGQQFEAQVNDPEMPSGIRVIGWAPTTAGAQQMVDAACLRPGWTPRPVVDLWLRSSFTDSTTP